MKLRLLFSVMIATAVLLNSTGMVFASSVSSLITASAAQSSSQEHWDGTVHVQGSILDAACAISTESKVQSVDLGFSSSQAIYSQGYGPDTKLEIILDHCTVTDAQGDIRWKNINAMFIGPVDDDDHDLFALGGESSGIGLQIRDSSGRVIHPGENVIVGDATQRDVKLVFLIRLASNSSEMNNGAANATLKLKINYD